LQVALDSIGYGVLFMDADLRIRLANRAYREIWDMPEDFFRNYPSLRQDMEYTRGQGLYQVLDDEWQEYVAGRIEAIRKGNIPPQELRLANGKVLQYECVALPDGGRMLTYFDITELTRIQEALRESLEQYDLATQGSNEALWDWDAASDVIYISPRFMYGRPPPCKEL
jgi:PAS domain-containing protein